MGRQLADHLAPRVARLRHQPDFARIRAKVLYILCRTDALFPPKIAPDVIKALTAAGVELRYFEIDSDLGHSSSGPEHSNWSPVFARVPGAVGRPVELSRCAGAVAPLAEERGERLGRPP
jgi:hypothetical protein